MHIDTYVHQPVLLKEVLQYLVGFFGECADAQVYVDGTIGEGGHAEKILEQVSPTGRLIGIDLDEHILQKAGARLERFGSRVRLVRNNFKNIKEILNELGLSQIDGFLADLGISSFQMESPEPGSPGGRGFSFQRDEPLDMRLDQRNPLTAAVIVNQSSEAELARIIWEYGEERWSRRISRAICSYRSYSRGLGRKKLPSYSRGLGRISTTGQLAGIVRSAIPVKFRSGRIDPATRTFQALRIAVNQELAGLDQAIRDAVDVLRPGARICVISFHSLEDRIVKRTFRSLSRGGWDRGDNIEPMPCPRAPSAAIGQLAGFNHHPRVKILTPKPVVATEEEVRANVRARSAKLRVAEKCREPRCHSWHLVQGDAALVQGYKNSLAGSLCYHSKASSSMMHRQDACATTKAWEPRWRREPLWR